MKHFTEDELNQKYSSYFPTKIKTLSDVLKVANIKDEELKIKCLNEKEIEVPNLYDKINIKFPKKKNDSKALKLLLIMLLRSVYFQCSCFFVGNPIFSNFLKFLILMLSISFEVRLDFLNSSNFKVILLFPRLHIQLFLIPVLNHYIQF